MKRLYTDRGVYKILELLDDNGKVISFAIADRNEEIVIAKYFNTASSAIDYTNKHFKGLLNER